MKFLLVVAAGLLASIAPRAMTPLRVCADPDNLPYTNSAGEGFENKLAALIARELGTSVEYVWWPQGRGFIRNTLNAGRCDVMMGLPAGDDAAATTKPYYRSTYVFITRRDARVRVRSFNDPALKTLNIGIQLVNEDNSSPPAYALSRRGIVRNVRGYSVYGDGGAGALVKAVVRGDVDVATAWGPQAGFFAARETVPLDITPVSPRRDDVIPQTFAISMAARRGDTATLHTLNRFIDTHRRQIEVLLATYHVPLVRELGVRRP